MKKNVKRAFNRVKNYLRKANIKTIHGYRMENGLHLNFYSPEKKIGIQIEGMKRPKNLRQAEQQQNANSERVRYCKEQGINLITIRHGESVLDTLNQALK